VRSICSVKRFSLGGKSSVDDEEVEMAVPKWLRQQLKGFNVTGFDVLVKLWDKCTSVGEYIEKYMFLSGSRNMCFTIRIHFSPIYLISLVFYTDYFF
jgi:hypothetical protein